MRRILALAGDYYHCSDQLVRALSTLTLPDAAELELVRYPDTPPATLAGYDLVILAAIGRLKPRESDDQWMTPSMQAELAEHVHRGAGLLLVHAGTASHPADGPFRRMTGGHFLHHPPEHPEVTIRPVAEHPITAGVEPFTHPDEHYFLEMDANVTPLLYATSTLGEQMAGWCRTWGSGRVAAIVPGHTRAMLEEPMLLRLLANAVRWSLGNLGSA